MEGVKVSTYLLDRSEVLESRSPVNTMKKKMEDGDPNLSKRSSSL